MCKFAVIDIGSNSVRLMLSNGEKTLEKQVLTTRLAEGMGNNLILQPTPIKRSAEAVSFFVKRAKGLGINNIWAFATAAVRNATNGEDFLRLCKELAEIEVEILSGEKEAYLGILGALNGNDGGLIDIGGASTEVVVREKGETTYLQSFEIGCVKITDIANQNEKVAIKHIEKSFENLTDIKEKNFTAIGGTALSVASILQQLAVYDTEKTNGYVIKKEELLKLKKKLYATPVEERINIIGLQEKRIETISGGVAILCFLMEKLKLNEISVSEGDNVEGYLKDKLKNYE